MAYDVFHIKRQWPHIYTHLSIWKMCPKGTKLLLPWCSFHLITYIGDLSTSAYTSLFLMSLVSCFQNYASYFAVYLHPPHWALAQKFLPGWRNIHKKIVSPLFPRSKPHLLQRVKFRPQGWWKCWGKAVGRRFKIQAKMLAAWFAGENKGIVWVGGTLWDQNKKITPWLQKLFLPKSWNATGLIGRSIYDSGHYWKQ